MRIVPIAILLFSLAFASGVGAQPFLDLQEVKPLSDVINSESEESYPIYAPNGKLFFVRSLHEDNRGGIRGGQDIWYSEQTSNGWSEPTNKLDKLNNRFNNGVVGVADSGNVLYLNSTYSNKPEYQIGVSKTEWVNGRWSSPQREKLRGFDPDNNFFTFYVDEKNEVMLMSFAEKDPANEDIYIAFKKGLSWSRPISIGGGINTAKSEFAPFLSEDGQVLYFSSNGYPGKGDFDIYMSRRVDESWTHWTQPVSLPEPINSAKFDAYFTIYGTDAYFSSNRDSDYANIYHARYTKRELEEIEEEMVKEEMFAEEEKMVGYVSAKDLSGLRELDLLNADGEVVKTFSAEGNGEFVLSGLDDYSKYYLDIKGENLDDATIFIVSKSGDRVYLNQELLSGKYPFETLDGDVKAILIAEVKDESTFKGTTFQLEGDSIAEGTYMSLFTEDGAELEKVEIENDGSFEFKKIQVETAYSMKGSSDLAGQILYLKTADEQIEISGNILKGILFKKVKDGSIILIEQDKPMSQEGLAKFAFESIEAQGTEVFLYDENGEVIERALVDEQGLFSFSKLDPEESYRLGVDSSVDVNSGLLFGFNEEGEKIQLANSVAKGKKFQGNPAWAILIGEGEEGFKFDYGDLPPAGSTVYLTDENDNIIDSAMVDAQGNFKFTRLHPDQNYKIKLADAQDYSQGLDRFFVIDAEGEKVALNAEGVTEKAIVGAALAEETEKFQFDETGRPPAGSTVYLTDENDVVVDSAIVDESGGFRFTRLKADGKYKLKLANADDMSMGLSRFFVIDAEGEKVALNEKGVSEKNLVGKELANSTDRFSFDKEAPPPPGTVVYLTDDFGNVVDSAVVDENGDVRFKRLDQKDAYKMKLAQTEDGSSGLGAFSLIDAEGERITFDESGASEGAVVGKDAAENTETFSFDTENKPEEGSIVYLTDEEDNIIDSAVVDENGEFRFTKLDPYGNYKIKLDKAQDMSKGLSAFFIYDAGGNKVELNEKGESVKRIVGKEEAKITRFYTFDYGELPPDGTIVYITDENDNIVDSVVVKNGGFNYRKLSSENGYGLQMQYPDGSMHVADNFRLKEENGDMLKLSNTFSVESYFSNFSEQEMEDRYDQFRLEGMELPTIGTKIYIYSDAGILKDSATLYSKGRFNVEKLKRQEDYIIKIADEGFVSDQAELYELIKEEKRRLAKLDGGYAFRPFAIEEVDDTEFNFSKFVIRTEQEIIGETKVYLYERDREIFVDSSRIASDGSFQFRNLNQEKDYNLVFDERIDLEQAEVLVVKGEEQTPIERGDNGFTLAPKEVMAEEEEEITMVIGSVKDENNIELKPSEPKEEVAEKPFKLTPPVDQREEPIPVPKSVVNETVFEEPPVKTETKVAQPVMDDSDWKPNLKIGEVYETKKGWNLHFGFNEFLLSDNQIEYLYQVVIPMLKKNPNLTLTIEGHTDSVGSEDVNYRMAILRASNVLYHLEMSGIEDTRFKIVPKGEGHPIAPNETPEGRAANRRVELVKDKKDAE